MNPAMKISRRQLALSLESEPRAGLSEDVREELVKALADLLLEALGEEQNERANESEDVHESQAFQ
jgi:hypothetical protein